MPQLLPPSKRVYYTNTTTSNLFRVHTEYILDNESDFLTIVAANARKELLFRTSSSCILAPRSRDPVADLDRDQRVEPIATIGFDGTISSAGIMRMEENLAAKLPYTTWVALSIERGCFSRWLVRMGWRVY